MLLFHSILVAYAILVPTRYVIRESRVSATFFFLSGFSFTNIHDSQDSRGMGEGIFLTPLYHFHLLHRHLDIGRAITAENTPRLTESFTFLDSVRLKVWPVAGKNVELLITFFCLFFWREGPDIYICKERAQMLLKRHSLNCLNFFLWNIVWSLWNNIA